MAYNSKYTGKEVEVLLDSVGNKQDQIDDLDEIRSGAVAGTTALQPDGICDDLRVEVLPPPTITTYGGDEYESNRLSGAGRPLVQSVVDMDYAIEGLITNKADKATTLSGYGITDGVMSSTLKNAVDLNTINGYGMLTNPRNAWATTEHNYPIAGYGGLLIYGNSVYDNTSIQIYATHNTNRWFARSTSTTAGERTEWKEFAFKSATLAGYGITDAVDLTSAQTIGGIKTFSNLIYQDTDIAGTNAWSRGIFLRCEKNIIGAIGAYGSNSSTLSHLYLGWGKSPAIAANNLSIGENKFTYKDNTIYHAGNLSPVTTDTEQTITGGKTFSNLRVNNSTMVTNLNAEMVGGLRKDGFQQAVYTYFPTSLGTDIANTTTLANIMTANTTGDKDKFKFYDTKFYSSASSTSNRAQIAYGYAYDNIYFRRYYDGAWTDWKTVAFTDSNVASAQALTHSNGTVGAIVAENGRLEKVYSLYNIYGVGVKIAQGSVPTSVGNLSPAVVFGLQDAIQSSYGTAIWGTANGKGHIQVGRLDKTDTAYSLCLQEFGGNVGIGTDAPTAKLHVNGDSIINGNLKVSNQLTIGNASITSTGDTLGICQNDQGNVLEVHSNGVNINEPVNVFSTINSSGNISAPNITTIQENVNTLMNKVQVGIKNRFVYYNLDEFLSDPTTIETILGDPVTITSSSYFDDTNRLIINSGVFNGVSKYQIECKYNREDSFDSDLTIECIESNNSGQIQLKAYHADGSAASMNGAYDVVITIYQNI